MIVGKTYQKYGFTQTLLNEACAENKVTPIYMHSDYFINDTMDVFYVVNIKDKPMFMNMKPVSYSKKHKIPSYGLINDLTKKKDIIRVDQLYLSTHYGIMPSSLIHYPKKSIFNPEEMDIRYTISQEDVIMVDDDTLKISDIVFKRIYINGSDFTYHFINEWGVVYDQTSNSIKKSYRDTKYYRHVSIDRKNYKIHRLVYNVWAEKKPWLPTDVQVDHIDGFKNHNWFENLREVTNLENYRASAYEQGLRSTRYSIEDIHTMCRMMQDGIYGPKDIANALGYPYDSVKKQMYAIQQGKVWRDIAEQYDFSKYYTSYHEHTASPDELIHSICKAYKSGNYQNNKDIATALGTSEYVVNTVLRGENRPDISAQYDLGYVINRRMTDDTTHQICKLLMEKVPNKEIAKQFGCTVRQVNDILRRHHKPKIGELYNFESIYPEKDNFEIPYKYS